MEENACWSIDLKGCLYTCQVNRMRAIMLCFGKKTMCAHSFRVEKDHHMG